MENIKREIELIFCEVGLSSRLKTQNDLLTLFNKNRKNDLASFLDWIIQNPEKYNPNKPSTILADEFINNQNQKSKWEQMEKDIKAYKNRIKVLQNLNEKYREKLGISNEPIDALGLISPLEDSSLKAE
jgi:cell shape-determining protein MreC